MTELELDRADELFPEHALEALRAATRAAIDAGRTRVIVRDGLLLKVKGDAVTVLRAVAPRLKVATRVKFASGTQPR